MGKGNVCVFRDYEGLYYIDREDIDYYLKYDEDCDCYEGCLSRNLTYDEITRGGWEYDELQSNQNYKDIIDLFIERFRKKFPSFEDMRIVSSYCYYFSTSADCILENGLYKVILMDNEWSVAVMLVRKEGLFSDKELLGLQKKHFDKYFNGMKDVLLDILPSIGIYAGPWTSGLLTREDRQKEKDNDSLIEKAV